MKKLNSIAYSLILTSSLCSASPVLSYYELTINAAVGAHKGWGLYKEGKFVSSFRDGYYTNPNPKKRGYEFWSNGRYAKYDRDSNGHHETILKVMNGSLIYIGSIGDKGKFVHTSNAYHPWLGVLIPQSLDTLN